MKKNTIPVLLFSLFVLSGNLVAQNTDLVWAHQLGNNFNDKYSASTVDQNSNILSVGQYTFLVDADPGDAVYELDNNGRVFIQKLDINSNFIWAKSIIANTGTNLKAKDIATDLNNNVISIGTFGGATDFDPSEEVYELEPEGYNDTFIHKMDSDGNFLWIVHFGSNTLNAPVANATDDEGNIYLTGTFMGEFDFNPDPDEEVILNSYEMSEFASAAVYVMKLNPDGEFLWAYSIPNDGKGGLPSDIKADVDGNVYVTGYFTANTNFGMAGSDEFHLGSHDAYLVKYDTNGNFQWIQIIDSPGFNKGVAIAIGDNGTLYSTGSFSSTNVDFDPSEDEFLLSASGFYEDIYVQKLNTAGELLWAKAINGEGTNTPNDISVEKSGDYNVFITGMFSETADFDPNDGIYELTATSSAGTWGNNMFVEKLSPSGTFDWAIQIENSNNNIPESVISLSDGGVMISGQFSTQADFDPSDNVFEMTSDGLSDGFIAKYIYCLDETFVISENNLAHVNAECVVETLTAPTAHNGCGIFFQGTPDISLPITEEGDYTINWTYENNDGLTLTQTQELTLNFINTEIINMGDHLSAAPGYSYQWIDCDNGNAEIPGATNQDFYPGTSGYFALKITNNEGCFFNTPCQHYFAVGLTENEFTSHINIYPNPTSANISIDFDQQYENLNIRMLDIFGKQIQQWNFQQSDKTELLIQASKGWYFIEIENEFGEIARTKILKN